VRKGEWKGRETRKAREREGGKEGEKNRKER